MLHTPLVHRVFCIQTFGPGPTGTPGFASQNCATVQCLRLEAEASLRPSSHSLGIPRY